MRPCKRINQDPNKKKPTQVKPKAKKIVKEVEKKEEEKPEVNEKVAVMSLIADATWVRKNAMSSGDSND